MRRKIGKQNMFHRRIIVFIMIIDHHDPHCQHHLHHHHHHHHYCHFFSRAFLTAECSVATIALLVRLQALGTMVAICHHRRHQFLCFFIIIIIIIIIQHQARHHHFLNFRTVLPQPFLVRTVLLSIFQAHEEHEGQKFRAQVC